MYKFIVPGDESNEQVFSVDSVDEVVEEPVQKVGMKISEAREIIMEREFSDAPKEENSGSVHQSNGEKFNTIASASEYKIDYKTMSLDEQKLALFNRPYLEKYSSKKVSFVTTECTMLARTLVPMIKSARTLAHSPYLMAERHTYFLTKERKFIKLKDSYLSPATYTIADVDEGEVKAFLIQEDRLDVYKDLFGNFKWF